MDKKEIFLKITKKKEFSNLPEIDIKNAFSFFEKRNLSDDEKIKLTRQLLHRVFGVFGSRKIFSLKEKSPEWILRKHFSTRERIDFYEKIYKRIFMEFDDDLGVIDLGAGINGFSYPFFNELGLKVNYLAIESVGQFVDLMNFYFKKEKIKGLAKKISLFDVEKLIFEIKKIRKPRVIFLLKTVDSLEMMEKDYSKKLIFKLIDFSEKIVVSFPTKSLIKRKIFRANRKWFFEFIEKNFKILDNFEIGCEKFIIFKKK